MNTNSALNGPVAILNFPRSPKAFLGFAKAVHGAMTNNSSFPNPNPPLSVIKANINALDDAETRAETRTKGAAQARNAAKKQVINDLFHLRDYVQSVAETIPNPVAAAAVITSAFMSVRKAPQRDTPELSAKNTGISGEVELTAKAVAPVATYYWEHSLDQINWTSTPDTMQASTTIEGLPGAKVNYFRFRALTRAGKVDYSQVVSLLVQ